MELPTPEPRKPTRIYIDGKPHDVDGRQNLLHICLSLGLNIPYFCWHPALGSVGCCRQCAVRVYRDLDDDRGNILMSCMTKVSEGMNVVIDDPEVVEFRAAVIEWLMTNHPHDCPVCDEGGECHLQDMTVMTGHTHRRYRHRKKTYQNQNLGPFINHEMNRCIQCFRCLRFYRDFAGGRDFEVFGAHNHIYFGRQCDGTLENEFSGNLVEVCPTGVFTDKTLKRHYTRKWDLQSSPSICVNCGVGCNTFPGERYGELRRIHNRYNRDVNWYFLCDRGRFGYEFVNAPTRIRQARMRENRQEDARHFLSIDAAARHIAPLLADPSRVIGIGSPRASLEANYALRTLVGAEHFHVGIADHEYDLVRAVLDILTKGSAPSASLCETEIADAVFVIGEDVVNVAPVTGLALRQSVRQKPMRDAEVMHVPEWNDGGIRIVTQDAKGPFFIASPYETRLDDVATATHRGAPEDLTRLALAVAHAISDDAPAVPGLPDDARALAEQIATALLSMRRPLVVSGTSCASEPLLRATASVATALRKKGSPAKISLQVPECNTMGLAMMGGASLGDAFLAVAEGRADTVIILENDLYRRADADVVDAFLSACRSVIVLDSLESGTVARGDIVLPAATFAESDGTLVNNEGRAQRYYQTFVANRDEIQSSWRWLRDIMLACNRDEVRHWQSLDDVDRALGEALPSLAHGFDVAPGADFRIAGQKVAREPARYSGRTAVTADVSVFEPKPPKDRDSALSFSMEGFQGIPPAPLTPRFWAPGWNSVQAVTRFQEEVNGPLRGGPVGERLIQPVEDAAPAFATTIPAPFAPEQGKYLVLPRPHIFGSEERSVLSPGIAERSPRPYIGLSAEDLTSLGLAEGTSIELRMNRHVLQLPAQTIPGLCRGVAVVPVGLIDLKFIELPQWGQIVKVSAP